MLLSHDLWWNGPAWLKCSSTTWPKRDPVMSVDETIAKEISTEARKVIIHHVDCTREWELPRRYSSWTRLVRITAYVLRFIRHSKRKKNSQLGGKSPIEVSELREAAYRWFRLVQKAHFSKEWNALNKNDPIPPSSALKALRLMLGDDSLLRLGGRLHNAALEYGEKHPIILPKHGISELLIDHVHRATLHGGPQLTLRTLREKYWIIGGRRLVKKHIRRCVICAHQAARLSMQLMGNLPEPHVNPSSPFSHTGVDYAGPFGILLFVGQRARKHYIALFICLATKAIHLEIVEDYTTWIPGSFP